MDFDHYWRNRVNIGLFHWHLHEYQESIEFEEKALAIEPESAEAYCVLGLSLAARGESGRALEAYEHALKVRPDIPETWHNLGELYLEVGRYDDALRSFQKALELRPGIPDTHHSIGLTHLKLGNPAAALEQCELLHELDISKERDLRDQIAQS